MRFITLTLLLSILSCFTATGEAKTIRDLFASEPNNIFMLLRDRTRLDMLDYYDSGQKVAATNRLSGDDTSSQLIEVTPNSISLQLTDATRVDMLLYEQGKDSVVAVVKTATLPALDSRIAFYDTNWNLLSKKKIFEEPALSDFIVPGTDKDAMATINDIVKFPIVSYEIAAVDATTTITAHLNLEQFLSADDWSKVKPYLRQSLTYRRQGRSTKFKLQKQ